MKDSSGSRERGWSLHRRKAEATLERTAGSLVCSLIVCLACTQASLEAQGYELRWRVAIDARIEVEAAAPDFRGLAVGPRGDLFVLDGNGPTLVRLTRSGGSFRLGPTLALPGVVFASAIAFDKSGHLLVLDSRLGMVSRFVIGKGGLRRLSEVPTTEGASGLCVYGDSIVILAPTSSQLLEIHDQRGSVTARLGRPFGDDSLPDIVVASASYGPLLCLEKAGMVVVASSLLGKL